MDIDAGQLILMAIVRRALSKNFYALRGACESFTVPAATGISISAIFTGKPDDDLPSVIFRGDNPSRREQATPRARQQTRVDRSLRNVTCLGSKAAR